jgi:hypothetical protein
MQFIRAVPRLTMHHHDPPVTTMPVTFELDPGQAVGVAVMSPPRLTSHGTLEMYVCRRCGFVEWYCADPERVPIGPAYMTEDIDYERSDAGPFR